MTKNERITQLERQVKGIDDLYCKLFALLDHLHLEFDIQPSMPTRQTVVTEKEYNKNHHGGIIFGNHSSLKTSKKRSKK